MAGGKGGKALSNEETADLIDEIAKKIEDGDRSFDVTLLITTASDALLARKHIAGMQLLVRIDLMILTDNGSRPGTYEYVQAKVREMEHLDPAIDCPALRELADEIRLMGS